MRQRTCEGVVRLLDELRALALPAEKFAIFGSGPMGVRGLRDMHDIDVIVAPELFAELASRHRVDLVALTGIAGSLDKDVYLGDVVAATEISHASPGPGAFWHVPWHTSPTSHCSLVEQRTREPSVAGVPAHIRCTCRRACHRCDDSDVSINHRN